MEKLLRRFERFILLALLGMMMFVVLLSAVELAVILVQEMLDPPLPFLLEIDELLKVFGFFMLILIGLELMETIKVYLLEDAVHVEFILLVAIIAVARKVIVLDTKTMPAMSLIGIAALVLSLSAGYFLIKTGLKKES